MDFHHPHPPHLHPSMFPTMYCFKKYNADIRLPCLLSRYDWPIFTYLCQITCIIIFIFELFFFAKKYVLIGVLDYVFHGWMDNVCISDQLRVPNFFGYKAQHFFQRNLALSPLNCLRLGSVL